MRTLCAIIASVLITFSVLSCNKNSSKSATDTPSSGAIKFASDESFNPIINEQIDVYRIKSPKAFLSPLYISEVDAIKMLMEDSVQLVITARNFRQDELNYLKNKQLNGRAIPFAYDGMALIVNKANTDTCITVNDVRRILSGEVTSWKQINPNSKRGNITVVFDNTKSSAVQYCTDSILKGKPLAKNNIVGAKTSKDVINYVEKTPDAIGVIGSNWLNDKRDTTNTTWNKDITVMSVSVKDKATEFNSWKPYQLYLLDGRYPFVRTIYALLSSSYSGLAWGFAHFLESPKGQLVVLKSGLLPMRGDITIRDVRVKDE